jgi:hypothetical protein
MSLADFSSNGSYHYFPLLPSSLFPYSYAASFCVLTLVAYFIVYPKLAANVKPWKAVGHAAFISWVLVLAYGVASSVLRWSPTWQFLLEDWKNYSMLGLALAIGAIILSPMFLLNLILPHLPLRR